MTTTLPSKADNSLSHESTPAVKRKSGQAPAKPYTQDMSLSPRVFPLPSPDGKNKGASEHCLHLRWPESLSRGMEFMHPTEARWCRATDVITHPNVVEIHYRSRIGSDIYMAPRTKQMLLTVPIEVTRAEDNARHAHR